MRRNTALSFEDALSQVTAPRANMVALMALAVNPDWYGGDPEAQAEAFADGFMLSFMGRPITADELEKLHIWMGSPVHASYAGSYEAELDHMRSLALDRGRKLFGYGTKIKVKVVPVSGGGEVQELKVSGDEIVLHDDLGEESQKALDALWHRVAAELTFPAQVVSVDRDWPTRTITFRVRPGRSLPKGFGGWSKR